MVIWKCFSNIFLIYYLIYIHFLVQNVIYLINYAFYQMSVGCNFGPLVWLWWMNYWNCVKFCVDSKYAIRNNKFLKANNFHFSDMLMICKWGGRSTPSLTQTPILTSTRTPTPTFTPPSTHNKKLWTGVVSPFLSHKLSLNSCWFQNPGQNAERMHEKNLALNP